MDRFTIEERIFIVERMTLTRSRLETKRNFKKKFGKEVNLKTIDANFMKWKKFGSVQDQHKGNSGRKKLARTPENQEQIESLIGSNNKMSVRRLAFASDIKKSSVHRILKKDLRLKAYKPQLSQELKEGDDEKRLDFCRKVEELIQNYELDPSEIIFSDESHVYLKGSPNKQNNREWGLSGPENWTAVPLHSA